MSKKNTTLIAAILLISGCTREVYLQEVPCVDNECSPCPAVVAPCPPEKLECCPEIKAETTTEKYLVQDVPSAKITYVPCEQKAKTNCRTVCREVLVKK